MNLSTSGHVYTLTDPINGTFTLQFQNVVFKSTAATVNCQLILKTTGEILMAISVHGRFPTPAPSASKMPPAPRDATVAFNQNYLQPDFAVRLTPVSWLGFDGNAGFVPGLCIERRQCFV